MVSQPRNLFPECSQLCLHAIAIWRETMGCRLVCIAFPSIMVWQCRWMRRGIPLDLDLAQSGGTAR